MIHETWRSAGRREVVGQLLRGGAVEVGDEVDGHAERGSDVRVDATDRSGATCWSRPPSGVVTRSSPALPRVSCASSTCSRSSSQPRARRSTASRVPSGNGCSRSSPVIRVPGVRRPGRRTLRERRGGRRGRRRPRRPVTSETLTGPRSGSAMRRPPPACPTSAEPSSATATLTVSDGRRTWRGRGSEVSTLPSSARRPSCVVATQASQRPSGDQLAARSAAGAGCRPRRLARSVRSRGPPQRGTVPVSPDAVLVRRSCARPRTIASALGVWSHPGRSSRCGSPSVAVMHRPGSPEPETNAADPRPTARSVVTVEVVGDVDDVARDRAALDYLRCEAVRASRSSSPSRTRAPGDGGDDREHGGRDEAPGPADGRTVRGATGRRRPAAASSSLRAGGAWCGGPGPGGSCVCSDQLGQLGGERPQPGQRLAGRRLHGAGGQPERTGRLHLGEVLVEAEHQDGALLRASVRPAPGPGSAAGRCRRPVAAPSWSTRAVSATLRRRHHEMFWWYIARRT